MVLNELLLLLGCESEGLDTREPPEPEDTAEDSAAETGDSDTDAPDSPSDTADTADTADTVDTDEPAPDPCPPGPDGDADGWTAEAGDCDDCDASRFPGAPELCDGIDQDCDGDTGIPPGGCAEGIDFADYPRLPGWIGTRDLAMVEGSFSAGGPGEEDLLVGQSFSFRLDDGDAVYPVVVHKDLPAEADTPWPNGYTLLTWPPSGAGYVAPGRPFRDHDGDGLRELVLHSPATEWTWGGVFLVDEPSGMTVEGDYEDVARASWYGPGEDTDFATDVDGAMDLDADGVADLSIVTTSRWVDRAEAPSRLYLVRGRADLSGELDPQDEVVIDGVDGAISGMGWTERLSEIEVAPDLDGDGGNELLIDSGVYGAALGSGAELLAADGGALTDVFVDLPTERGSPYTSETFFSPGDWDGDGLGEMVWTQAGATDEDDCVYVVSYPAPFGGDLLADTVQQLCMPNACNGGVNGTHDLDGDGVLDPIFTWADYGPAPETTWTNAQFLVPTTWLDGGRAEVTEIAIRIESDNVLGGVKTGDLDDDGYPELLWGAYEGTDESLTSEGWMRILPGFDIPFDDPTMWVPTSR